MNKDLPILVIGAGSIGERHIRNLWNLGYKNITVFRQRNLPFRDIGDAKVIVYTDWKEIERQNYFAAFICTPTSQHIDQVIQCLQLNMHVFVEKPLSHNLEKFEELEQVLQNKNNCFYVGYMLHFHPFLCRIKRWLADETFGKLRTFETTWHTYLPAWHPWENYKTSYAAQRKTGGGAALTLCHDVELMLWMCDNLKEYQSEFSFCSELKLDVNTGANITLEFNSAHGNCNISFCSKDEKRLYLFCFEQAQVEINYLQNEMRIHKGKVEITTLPQFERNDMYMCEVENFFSIIERKLFSKEKSIKLLAKEKTLISICNPEVSATNK